MSSVVAWTYQLRSALRLYESRVWDTRILPTSWGTLLRFVCITKIVRTLCAATYTRKYSEPRIRALPGTWIHYQLILFRGNSLADGLIRVCSEDLRLGTRLCKRGDAHSNYDSQYTVPSLRISRLRQHYETR